MKLDLRVLLLFLIEVVSENGQVKQEKGEAVLKAEKGLREYLVNKSDPEQRPVPKDGSAVRVGYFVKLLSLIKLDSTKEQAELHLNVHYEWDDLRLTWKREDHMGQKVISMNSSSVWVPDADIPTCSKIDNLINDRVWVHSNGSLRRETFMVVKTACTLDLTRFPYDSQVCKLYFDSNRYGPNQIEYYYYLPPGEKENAEWEIRGFAYNQSDIEKSAFTYNLLLRRNSKFYTTVIILPTILITTIHIIGMFTPSSANGDHGEKVTFGLTTLLAMSVILGAVGEEMPKISKVMPLLAKFVIAEMSMTVITIVVAVVIVFAHERVLCRRSPPSLWLYKFVLREKNNKLVPSPSQPPPADDVQLPGLDASEYHFLQLTLQKIRDEIDASIEECTTIRDWQRVFHRIDFVFMWLFITVNSAVVLALLLPAALTEETAKEVFERSSGSFI